MFDNNQIDMLKKMYKIFVRVKDTKKYIIARFREFIINECSLIISNRELVGDHADGEKPKPAGPG